MNEKLMQFIWQRRFIGNGPFYLLDGNLLEIISPGTINFNQGPDFLNARIKIGQTEWAGNIELHINASDWYKHKHESDLNYRNIILHVVWINDSNIQDPSLGEMYCFCMEPYVPNLLLNRYKSLMFESQFIKPCASFLPALNRLQWLSWKERLVIERLEKRSQKIIQLLQVAKQDWETVSWWLLASNMGLKVNADLFFSVAQSITIKILANHRNQIHQLEALLMEQANLLNQTFEDLYPIMLQKEYHFLQKKYGLPKQTIQPAYLRMRPASFPTLRLAQLARLLQTMDHFFDFFKNADNISFIKKKLSIVPNDYWLYHYHFDELGTQKEKRLGNFMINNMLINTVIPIVYSYGLIKKEISFQEKAVNWLMEIAPEQNRITKEWAGYRILNHTAFDSQSLLELNNCYCKEKLCLNCAVGVSILSTT